MKHVIILFAALLLQRVGVSRAQDIHADTTRFSEVRLELENRYGLDQDLRQKIGEVAREKGFDSEDVKALWEEQSKRDADNMNRLIEIIDLIGWPGVSKVGEKGASAAFLILQHAEYEYQKKYLPMVRLAVEDGDLGADNLAMLEDRVLVREGKPQLYGTQLFQTETGELQLNEIYDEKNVDKRRSEMGLVPIAEYVKRFGLEYSPKQ